MRAITLRWLLIPSIAFAAFLTPNPAPVDPSLLSGLVWRNIGPFRGGRVAAVTGAIGQPGTFYMGLPLGGVWKTTSAGTTWYPIMDDVKEVSSVGSIQVAPSDPNILYAGMGDLITGGGINEGNGVYKSTDAGKTWQHLGLDDTKQIPSILVDPKDPNLVMIAAQGNIRTETDQRGVFRSTDGGKTWKKTLYVDNHTGVQEIAWAFDNPKVMLATTVRHYNAPGGRGAGGGGGGGAPAGGRGAAGPAQPTGTTLFKSTDEGLTWTEVVGHGLPAAADANGKEISTMAGRTSIAVAMNTNSQRMFLIGNFGFYRSDDGGANWKQMAANDTRIRNGQNGYNCGVYVDPKNPDLVYTINTSSFISRDGGNTFTGFKGAPGGDDPQQMWIDPTDGRRMFLGVDQGATISLDGGVNWSSWYNQSTEQVYHISVDNSYPYWVYATQQDAGSIGTRSRGDLGAITQFDWYPQAGYEFGYIVADPLNPKIVYAGGPASGLVKITYPSGQWINVGPNLDTSKALRKVTNQPLVWSPFNKHELMVAYQYVMTTTDGGMHWKTISPDLGYPKGETAPPRTAGGGRGRGAAGGGAGGPAPGSIESLSPSSVANGTIWAGTNNGLIKLTKDHGLHWTDVSIPDSIKPPRGDISTVDASHHDSATAYVAIDYHGQGDMAPYFYRTRDYGKTWTKIVTGMRADQPSGSFGRVIRADTKKKGLLFAGTESSVYVSFDDGDNWQPLMLNLPNTSYRDMVIKDNDLVVGTYGRGIFILDDFSPLRQITPAVAAEPAHLFKPGDAIRVRRNVNGDTPLPPEIPHALNPPLGAIIYYSLSAKPSSDITIDISDAAGRPVRHMSSAPITPYNDAPIPVPDHWIEVRKPMPANAGLNRINWNIRYDNPPSFSHSYPISANTGETPATPEGPIALPGVYTVKLTVDGKSSTQTVTVRNDPRSPATAEELRAENTLLMKLYGNSKLAFDGYTQANTLHAAVTQMTRGATGEVATATLAFDAKVVGVGGAGGGGGRGGGGGAGGRGAGAGAPPQPNFGALMGNFNRQLETLDSGDMAPNEPMLAAYLSACTDLRTAIANWKTVSTQDLATFNAVLTRNGVAKISAEPSAMVAPVCVQAPAATPAKPPRN